MRGEARCACCVAKKKGTERTRCLVRDISSDVILIRKVFVSSDPRANKPEVCHEWGDCTRRWQRFCSGFTRYGTLARVRKTPLVFSFLR